MDALVKGLLQGSVPTIVLVGGTHYLVKGFKVSRPVVYWGSLAVATGLTYAVVVGKIKVPFMNAEEDDLYYCSKCDEGFSSINPTDEGQFCDSCLPPSATLHDEMERITMNAETKISKICPNCEQNGKSKKDATTDYICDFCAQCKRCCETSYGCYDVALCNDCDGSFIGKDIDGCCGSCDNCCECKNAETFNAEEQIYEVVYRYKDVVANSPYEAAQQFYDYVGENHRLEVFEVTDKWGNETVQVDLGWEEDDEEAVTPLYAETFNAEYEDCQVCFTTVEKGGLNDVQAGLICDTCYDMNKYAGGTGKENNRPYSAETFEA